MSPLNLTKTIFGSTTLQRSLMLNLVLLIVVMAAGVLGATYFLGAKQAVAVASRNLVKSTNDKTEDELTNLLEGVSKNLKIARKWGIDGELDLNDPAALTSRFIPMLEQYSQVSSMLLANARGEEWMMLRDGSTWLNRITRPDEWKGEARWLRWRDVDSLLDTWEEQLDYDARRRPWFRGALETDSAEEIHWTTPYTFFTTKDPGITASTRFKMAGDTATFVIAFDVLLLDISIFTTSSSVGRRGKCVVLSDDGRVLGLPSHSNYRSRSDIREAVLKKPAELDIPVASTAHEIWISQGTPSDAPFNYSVGDDKWWGAFRSVSPGQNRSFWIAAFVPESDFGAGSVEWRNYIISITAVVIFLAVLMAVFLSRKYGIPLKELAIESRRVRDLALSGKQPGHETHSLHFCQPAESGIAEIDELANDIEEMSVHLEAKSRELAEYSRTLERRVSERTKDLNEKNAELQKTLRQLQEAQQQLILREKMASLGNLVAGVAHEINNPIGAIRSAADVSRRCMTQIDEAISDGALNRESRLDASAKLERAVSVLNENTSLTITAISRIAGILKSLKTFSRLDSADYVKCDIHEGIDSTLVLVNHLLKDRIEVVKNYGEIPMVRCYPNQINQVFMNLLVNASQAIEGEGRITISTLKREDVVIIKVSDTGKGIPSEVMEKIFHPGFTTKGVGIGTGLGLSISYNIIDKHKGRIYAESKVGGETTFTIELPVEGPESEQDRNARRQTTN